MKKGVRKVKSKSVNKDASIALPKEDIKVEKGQLTFLPAIKKIINKKNVPKKAK